ncbi:class I SAM-dependent methyltransferase family protein, partial [Natrinema soli]
ERLAAAADEAGRGLEVLEKRRVKSHSAGVDHVVVDARFE